MRLRLGLIGISAMTCCSQHCPVRRGLSSGLKLDHGWDGMHRASSFPHCSLAASPSTLPLSARSCRCGRLLDVLGHHRAACARAGVLGQRGFAIESVVARICREAGGRVRTNVMVRDLDMGIHLAGDARRLDVVVDGLPLFSGRQLAVNTTLVGALHADGSVRPRAANEDGAASVAARRRKECTYPELVLPGSRVRLVVLARS